MGSLRFTRRRTIAPGVRLNLSRSGPSLTFGGAGFHYTVGHGRRRTTVGVPGTGLSYTSVHSTGRRRTRRAAPRRTPARARPPRQSLTRTARTTPVTAIVIALVLLVPCIILAAAAPLIGLAAMALPAYMIAVATVQLRRPATQDARLLARAAHHPDQAEALLTTALATRPGDPTLLAAMGDLRSHEERWAEAIAAYRAALAAGPSSLLQGRLGECCLHLHDWDGAIAALGAVRLDPALSEESRFSVTAHLALAFLAHGDAGQALELVRTEPLQRRTLGPELQQCLYIRAAAHYALGRRADAIHDLDRLYALNAAFPGIEEAKAEMAVGTFQLMFAGQPVAA